MYNRSRFPSLNLLSISIAVIAFLAISAVGSPTNRSASRKLDEVDQSKCGGCPCGNPCAPIYASPPPPPPVLPPPPPPPPKKPQPYPSYCPPPPPSPSNFIYITGPPGDLYPIGQSYGGGHRSFAAALPAAIGGGLVALFMMW